MTSIEYQLVSEGAILRDYIEPEYVSEEHKRLVDIADSLYNMNIPVSEWGDNPEYDYKKLYAEQGEEYWALVLKDMSAIDSQLTSEYHRDELIGEYEYQLERSTK